MLSPTVIRIRIRDAPHRAARVVYVTLGLAFFGVWGWRPSAAQERHQTVLSPQAGPTNGTSGAKTIRKASRHFRDYFFVAMDEAQVDAGNQAAMEALAYELVAGIAVERSGPVFMKAPQGFRVTGSEAAALRLTRDPRVKGVEEVGTFLRAQDAHPGEYHVVLQRSVFDETHPIELNDVRQVAEDLTKRYGGRVTENVWRHALVAFMMDNATEASARAMSEDPRVEYVAENPVFEASVETNFKVDKTP
jgi:hypothetical protein